MAAHLSSRRYRFRDFTLSPARRSLRHKGREVPLIPRYLDLLLLLVERRSEALPRQAIFDAVWSDVVVSDGALTQAVRTLRRALGEDGSGGTYIRTVSRFGYQFVCPVTELDDGDDEPTADEPPVLTSPEASNEEPGDPFVAPLARLRSNATPEEERREAAEELHQLGTAEALRRLGDGPAGARAWAYLRDSRWEAAGAGPVPLFGASAGLAGWRQLVALRVRRARRLVAARWVAASIGGATAGLLAGLLGGVCMLLLDGPGPSPFSLILGLGLVGAFTAGIGAVGAGSGLAAAEALVRSWRTPALVFLGALGGAVVAALARRGVDAFVAGLFAYPALDLGGGIEGLVMGAAAGLGYGLSTGREAGGMATPRGTARVVTCLATGLACAVAAAGLCAGGFRLGAVSLHAIVAGFPDTQVHFEAFARLTGEGHLGPRTWAALGSAEGLFFGTGLAAGLTHRPERRNGEG